MTEFKSKLLDAHQTEDNDGNREWWEKNPMLYDWDNGLDNTKVNEEYFDSIDEIFGYGHSLVNNPSWPKGRILENFLPYEHISGKQVLEIGCGAGLVSLHLAQSGAKLTAIDITSTAVELTKKRFDIYGAQGNIRQVDAERIDLPDSSMDYVVSWGVIHHSGNTDKIVQEIFRILKPGGKAYLMVYNKNSLRYQVYCRFWLGVVRLKLLSKSVKEIAGEITDGHIARHYTRKQFSNIAYQYKRINYSCSDEKHTIMMYLMGSAYFSKKFFSITKKLERWLATRYGWYLEVVLEK